MRVQYATERRVCAFLETIARFRTPLDAVARLNAMQLADPAFVDALADVDRVPDDWHLKRRMGALLLEPGQRWPDGRHPETQSTLRLMLAGVFSGLGLTDFDTSDVLSRDRRVTQAISRWAVEEGFAGIVYESRLDRACVCWAVYEGARFTVAEDGGIRRDDPDLVAAAAHLGVQL